MNNAVHPRSRRVVYQFGLLWCLVNSSISSVAFYLPHRVLYSNQAFDADGWVILILIGLVHGLSQVILIRKYFQARLQAVKIAGWVLSMFLGVTLIFLTTLAIVIILAPVLTLGFSRLGTSAPPSLTLDTLYSDLVLFSKALLVISSIISGGVTGFLQFAILRKCIKSAHFWIVAIALSGGLNALIYIAFWSRLLGNADSLEYRPIVVLTSGTVGVVYGLITGVAMMVMLHKTIEYKTRLAFGAIASAPIELEH